MVFLKLLLLCLFHKAKCGSLKEFVRFSGNRCPPEPTTVSNFDAARYQGRWYQAQGIPTFFSPSGSECIAANYALQSDGTVSVRNSGRTFGKYIEVCGVAKQVNPEQNNGKLSVQFPPSPFPGSYLLIGTDYYSYASVWSCEEVLGKKIAYAWVLTRDQFPSQDTVNRGRLEFISRNLDISKMETIQQGNCVYEPQNGSNCLSDSSGQTNPFAGGANPFANSRNGREGNPFGSQAGQGQGQSQNSFRNQDQGGSFPTSIGTNDNRQSFSRNQPIPPPFGNSNRPQISFQGNGQSSGDDQCPREPSVVQNFDAERYTGRWFQYEGLPTFFSPSGSQCIAANYDLKNDGSISVRNSAFTNGNYMEVCGTATPVNPEKNEGRLTVAFPPSPGGSYLLIGTDYTSYACVYSCDNVFGQKISYAWVLTRDQFPSEETLRRARNEFTRQGISVAEFERIPQGSEASCIYEPKDGPNCIQDPSRASNPFAGGANPFGSGSQGGNPFSSGSQGGNPFSSGSQGGNPLRSGSQGGHPFSSGSQGGNPFSSGSQGENPFSSGSQSKHPISNSQSSFHGQGTSSLHDKSSSFQSQSQPSFQSQGQPSFQNQGQPSFQNQGQPSFHRQSSFESSHTSATRGSNFNNNNNNGFRTVQTSQGLPGYQSRNVKKIQSFQFPAINIPNLG